MPYIITPRITLGTKGEWFEGTGYEKENLYKIEDGTTPPVNYDAHILRPHSLAHIETALHTQKNGKPIDYYIENYPNYFFGSCIVIKFEDNNWSELDDGIKHKIVGLEELKYKLRPYKSIEKVLITVENIKENKFGYHCPNFVLTLSLEAAKYLTSLQNFNLFGTTWKSSDFMPGSQERPIHDELFKKALILEYINLNKVPEGEYFLNCFPLNLENASESPVTAILFKKNELIGLGN